MDTLLVFLVAGIVLELLLYAPLIWKLRAALVAGALFCTVFASAGILLWETNLFSALLFVLSAYRVFNNVRVMKGRMHEQFLWVATLRTGLALIVLQALVGAAWLAWGTWHITGHTAWIIVTALQLAAAVGSLAFIVRTIKRTSWPVSQKHYSDEELPTLSVAIPARNETTDLQECLETLIASDYPKLEILVLDDCSQTKKTPEIIRSFAHAGVRFLKGEEPRESWLAKNWAYHHLEREASGQYVLFCGADVRFAPNALRKLVELLLARQKTMASILPKRARRAYSATSLIQAMRYWWELVPPRRLFNRPPVLSSCWIIKRSALKDAGGFKAVARAIVPEAHFARRAVQKTDGYSFLRAGRGIGIESVKKASDQRNTAVRMRYPQMHRRPEQVALHAFLEMFFLLLPFALLIGGFWLNIGTVAHLLAALACICLVIVHELVVLSTHVNTWWFGLVAPPFMIITDMALLHYSMWKYEFSKVEWKGRNVCIPAMYVASRLPKV